MWPGSGVAVAVAKAGSCSSDYTPSLGTSICHECGPKMTKKKKNTLLEIKSHPKGLHPFLQPQVLYEGA